MQCVSAEPMSRQVQNRLEACFGYYFINSLTDVFNLDVGGAHSDCSIESVGSSAYHAFPTLVF